MKRINEAMIAKAIGQAIKEATDFYTDGKYDYQYLNRDNKMRFNRYNSSDHSSSINNKRSLEAMHDDGGVVAGENSKFNKLYKIMKQLDALIGENSKIEWEPEEERRIKDISMKVLGLAKQCIENGNKKRGYGEVSQ